MINAIASAPSPLVARPDLSKPDVLPVEAVEPAPVVAPSSFEAFARSFDIRSMTPRDVDEMAEKMPVNSPEDSRAKMILLTRGEGFLTHAAALMEERTGVDQSEALAAQLSAQVDLIESFETARKNASAQGSSTEGFDTVLDYLHRMEARRYLPEGGIRV